MLPIPHEESDRKDHREHGECRFVHCLHRFIPSRDRNLKVPAPSLVESDGNGTNYVNVDLALLANTTLL
jgi:hypothetical protein